MINPQLWDKCSNLMKLAVWGLSPANWVWSRAYIRVGSRCLEFIFTTYRLPIFQLDWTQVLEVGSGTYNTLGPGDWDPPWHGEKAEQVNWEEYFEKCSDMKCRMTITTAEQRRLGAKCHWAGLVMWVCDWVCLVSISIIMLENQCSEVRDSGLLGVCGVLIGNVWYAKSAKIYQGYYAQIMDEWDKFLVIKFSIFVSKTDLTVFPMK